ncbi:methylenetetrahydrofolate dehydrogenase [Amylocarpus encephaloides]|uniref:Methylenetetrahydrofolate dehydrogenase [NAD(+)] n=1 Tax=Amylocarpus encephaloides TaxID=45428 RepID=A0A9P7YK95_9HELO|nr:methylenetetrahydrofolate dehydrogenase [Amylocarpus encephaloides]
MATPAPASATNCKVILAGSIAKALLAEVAEGLSKLTEKPKLVGFLANGDPAGKMYADWSAKTSRENGFEFDLRVISKEEIEEAVLAANSDSTVNGIIVYYPIFSRTSGQDSYVKELVDLSKDVEGLTHKYVFNMYQNIRYLDAPTNNVKSILPCTPLAVVKVLEYLQIYNSILPYGNRLFGKTITVINRSEVVGRPLAALLANDGAKVHSIDLDGIQVFTRGEGIKKKHHEVHDPPEGFELQDCLAASDVVISGVPSASYKVDPSLLRDGCVCINFSSEKNFDGPAVKEKASIYVPAIGKVTIAVLLRNLLRLVQNQKATAEAAAA